MSDISKIRKIVQEVLVSEFNDAMRKEVEIIYKDQSIIAMVPRSQMASKVYGGKTAWCSVTPGGFNAWSKEGLLIRFLFKGGRKIRLTYIFDKDKSRHGEDYNWAREDGNHTLTGRGNPFEIKLLDTGYSEREKDVFELISQIPQECKNKVLEFIEKHRQGYEYCYREEEYYGKNTAKKEAEVEDIQQKYEALKEKMQKKHKRAVVSLRYSKSKNKFEVSYTPNWTGEDYPTETFVDSKPAEKKYAEMINQYLNIPPVKNIGRVLAQAV